MAYKYTVKKFNEQGKFWSNYDSTFCMTDAYAMQHALRDLGYLVTIERTWEESK